MRASFILSEIGIGLRRNLTMTVAVIVTTAVSLAFFGVRPAVQPAGRRDEGLLVRQGRGVGLPLRAGQRRPQLCRRRGLAGPARPDPGRPAGACPRWRRSSTSPSSRPTTRFKEQFKESAIADNVTADQMPESFRVKLKDPEQFAIVATAFAGRAGVEQVQDQKALLEKFFRVLNGLKAGAWGLALIMIVAAVLLIANTIRVAAFSRRRETGIMRLVGASSFSIQLPFLLEGAIAGLIGGAAWPAARSRCSRARSSSALRAPRSRSPQLRRLGRRAGRPCPGSFPSAWRWPRSRAS